MDDIEKQREQQYQQFIDMQQSVAAIDAETAKKMVFQFVEEEEEKSPTEKNTYIDDEIKQIEAKLKQLNQRILTQNGAQFLKNKGLSSSDYDGITVEFSSENQDLCGNQSYCQHDYTLLIKYKYAGKKVQIDISRNITTNEYNEVELLDDSADISLSISGHRIYDFAEFEADLYDPTINLVECKELDEKESELVDSVKALFPIDLDSLAGVRGKLRII